MPEEGNINPQGLSAGSTEFEEMEIELTDEDKAELSKIDWSGDSTAEPQEEENTAEPEEQADDIPESTEVEYELPDGRKVTAEQLAAYETYEKRYKDLQADYTRKAQENAELQQRMMAQQYSQEYAVPQFQPQPFQPTEMEVPYATEGERLLMDKVRQLEQKQVQRDYQEWQRGQREALERANNLVSEFRSKHSEVDDVKLAEIISEANRSSTTNLELVYRGMRNFDAELEQARKDAQVEMIEKLRKKKGAALESSAQPGKAPEEIDYTKLTEEQINALMVKELREGG